VIGNNVARGGGGLKITACDTNWTACAVAVSPVMYTGLPNACRINCVGTSQLNSRMNLRLITNNSCKVRIGLWNVGTLNGES